MGNKKKKKNAYHQTMEDLNKLFANATSNGETDDVYLTDEMDEQVDASERQEAEDRYIGSKERVEMETPEMMAVENRNIGSNERVEMNEPKLTEVEGRSISSDERVEMEASELMETEDRRFGSEERGELEPAELASEKDRRFISEEHSASHDDAVTGNARGGTTPAKGDDSPIGPDANGKNFAYHAAMALLKEHQIFADNTGDECLLIYDERMGYFKRWKKQRFGTWLREAIKDTGMAARLGRHMVEDIFSAS